MRLVYAVADNVRMHAVSVTDKKPDNVVVDEKAGTWNNQYKKQPAPKLGQFWWWSGYRDGTVIGVYDIDDLHHLTLLANLVSNCQNQEAYDRIPSRDT